MTAPDSSTPVVGEGQQTQEAADTTNNVTITGVNNSPAPKGGGDSSSTTFSSMADLQRKNPKLYNMMLQGIAMSICGDMQRKQEKIKEMNREARANDNR